MHNLKVKIKSKQSNFVSQSVCRVKLVTSTGQQTSWKIKQKNISRQQISVIWIAGTGWMETHLID
jgi:rhamnose utilization protein RhaD (predicted bifunctional aldolase and dehydrogenase)